MIAKIFSQKNFKQILSFSGLILITMISIGSLWYTLNKNLERKWTDLYCYWYSAHFIRQGEDPYQAYLEAKELQFPIFYLDGKVARTRNDIPQWKDLAPGNTAPFLFMMLPLTLFSWDTVGTIWTVTNIVLGIFVTCVIIQLIGYRWKSFQMFTLLCTLYSLLAMRATLDSGQFSLLIFLLCLLALSYAKKYPIFSGILLGIGLSKYTLAFPAFLLLLYKRQYKPLVVSILVQGIGVVALAWIAQTSVIDILKSYVAIPLQHIFVEGNQLSVTILRPLHLGMFTMLVIGSIILLIPLFLFYHSGVHVYNNLLTDLTLFALLNFWNILFIYHHSYDHVVTLVFIALIFFAMNDAVIWYHMRARYQLTSHQKRFINGTMVILLLFWIFPTGIFFGVTWQKNFIALSNIVGFLFMAWLLLKIKSYPEHVLSQENEA